PGVERPRAERRGHRQRHRLEPVQHPRYPWTKRNGRAAAGPARAHLVGLLVDAGRNAITVPGHVRRAAGEPLGGWDVPGGILHLYGVVAVRPAVAAPKPQRHNLCKLTSAPLFVKQTAERSTALRYRNHVNGTVRPGLGIVASLFG